MRGRWVVAVAIAGLVPAICFADDGALSALLSKGPVVMVQEDDHGRFHEATAIIEIDAPADHVWRAAVAMERFKDFVPKVVTSEVRRRSASGFDVRFVYDIPGPDTDYTARVSVDEEAKELRATWLADDLRGSSWTWRVVPSGPNRTLLFHTVRVKNFSPLLQQVEDDEQTVTVGVNVSSALSTVKALKRRSEEKLARR